MRKLLIAAASCLLVGCASMREPGKEAALGMMAALRPPALEDPLLLKLRTLLERNVDDALEGGVTETAADVAAAIVGETFDRLGKEMPAVREGLEAGLQTAIAALRDALRDEMGALRPALRQAARDATDALIEGMAAGIARNEEQLLGLTERVANRLGRGLTEGMVSALFDELEARIGAEGTGPLSEAMTRAAERVMGAGVRAAVGAVAAELPSICPGEDRAACLRRILFDASFTAAAGATAGVGAQITPWHLALAGMGGAVAGLFLALLVWAVASRAGRRPRRGDRDA